jgi:hypothetical protein
MKVRSNIYAGMTFEECDSQRNYWKTLVKTPGCVAYPNPPATTPPPSSPPTTSMNSNCAWINGVYYPDLSGICG